MQLLLQEVSFLSECLTGRFFSFGSNYISLEKLLGYFMAQLWLFVSIFFSAAILDHYGQFASSNVI